MSSKSILPCLLAAVLLVGTLIGQQAGAEPRTRGPLVVGTDKTGDWGENVHPSLPLVGDLLGMDLVEASIEMADPSTVRFIITVDGLPATGGMPEISRYLWEVSVDGKFFLLDGKFTNYSRGTCDPFSGSCPPLRDPGMSPFILFDRCDLNPYIFLLTECHEVGQLQGTFDPSASTVSVSVPLELIGGRPGSRIGPGGGPFLNAFGGNVVAGFAAYRTQAAFPADAMRTRRVFVVPRS